MRAFTLPFAAARAVQMSNYAKQHGQQETPEQIEQKTVARGAEQKTSRLISYRKIFRAVLRTGSNPLPGIRLHANSFGIFPEGR
jgi:hypothetical protein